MLGTLQGHTSEGEHHAIVGLLYERLGDGILGMFNHRILGDTAKFGVWRANIDWDFISYHVLHCQVQLFAGRCDYIPVGHVELEPGEQERIIGTKCALK
jgi:hypothetical protein